MGNDRTVNIHPKITPKENLEFSKLSNKLGVSKVELYEIAISLGLKELKEVKNVKALNRKRTAEAA